MRSSSLTNRIVAGLTRDASKPTAQAWIAKGVNIQEVNNVSDNHASVTKAFEGADIVFVSGLECDEPLFSLIPYLYIWHLGRHKRR